jgi:hypothetical protein
MKIVRATFTGADESVNPDDLFELSCDFPFAEWGILDSENKNGIEPRYPSRNWVDYLFRNKKSEHISHHICGKTAKEFLKGNYNFRWNFDRIQINRIINVTDHSLNKLEALCKRVNKKETKIIIQLRGHKNDIIAYEHMKSKGVDCNPLFDPSGGRGKVPEKWTPPVDDCLCGYAGGLNSSNIQKKLELIESAVGDREVWIDIETGVRSDDNKKFLLNEVEICLKEMGKYAVESESRTV